MIIGNYSLGQQVRDDPALIESHFAYAFIPRAFEGERILSAGTADFMGRQWSLMLGTIGDRIYKMSAQVLCESNSMAMSVHAEAAAFCDGRYGAPSHHNLSPAVAAVAAAVWNTPFGNVVLDHQTALSWHGVSLQATSAAVLSSATPRDRSSPVAQWVELLRGAVSRIPASVSESSPSSLGMATEAVSRLQTAFAIRLMIRSAGGLEMRDVAPMVEAVMSELLVEPPVDDIVTRFRERHLVVVRQTVREVAADRAVSEGLSYLFAGKLLLSALCGVGQSGDDLARLAERAAELGVYVPTLKEMCGDHDAEKAIAVLARFARAYATPAYDESRP